jgi:DNA-binding transcriptional LysR family regulator
MALVDRRMNLVEEQVDIALRVGSTDSSLKATKVGAVRHVVCAIPPILSVRAAPRIPMIC